MDDREKREEGWNNAVHAHGTYTIFDARSRRLAFLSRLRDWLGICVPVLIGVVATTEGLNAYKKEALFALGVAGALQFLFSAWALVSKWDEELSYSTRAARDSYELREAWAKIGRGRSENIDFDFKLIGEQQKIIDSHDIQRGISADERRRGLRAGLFHFERTCVCGRRPKLEAVPKGPEFPCDYCGGN